MTTPANTIRLLLVDDERDYLETMAKRLRVRGFEVSEATNGKEALEVLAGKAVDVAVLDVRMPVMDGLEALHRIKKDFPRIEVIVLTGHASPQDGVEGIKSGAFDYLCKPIEFDHLLGKIKQAYDKILWEEEKVQEARYRARMEQQMIATERLASVGIMASGVAHEINNPLAIIQEAAGWMKTLIGKPEAAEIPNRQSLEAALDKIFKSVERAKRITHQLLGFVRKEEPSVREVRIQELVAEVVSLAASQAKGGDVQVRAEVPEEPLLLWTDPYPLRQVLLNLVNNAIQASPRGEVVTLEARNESAEIILSVRDGGGGIPRENLHRIFEPFFTTKSPAEGTGLGLFVSRNIVEKLGGKIEVESQLGKGSTFSVRFPAKSGVRTSIQ